MRPLWPPPPPPARRLTRHYDPGRGQRPKNPTKNVIRVINDWAEKVLKIRLSNVNIKQDDSSTYADGKKEESIGRVSDMTVKGSGNTKLELDGKNVLDSTDAAGAAGLYKDNGDGWLTITDETDDQGKEITSAKKDGLRQPDRQNRKTLWRRSHRWSREKRYKEYHY